MANKYKFYHYCALPDQLRSAGKYCRLEYTFDEAVHDRCIITKPYRPFYCDFLGDNGQESGHTLRAISAGSAEGQASEDQVPKR